MNKIVSLITRLTCAVALTATAACETQKSLTPTSPNVAGPIAGVNISSPAPVSPANGTEVLNTETLRLVFGNANSNSERKFWYIVELAADAGFNTKLYTNPRVDPADGQQTSLTIDVRLGAEATYYWRVKADDGANASDYSAVAHFDIVVPIVVDPPIPASPINGTTTANNTPDLVVTNGRVQGRTGEVIYRYEVALDQAFGNKVSVANVARSGGGTTTHPSAPLPPGLALFWRVWATNGEVTTGPSAVQSFRTPAAPAPGPGPAPEPAPRTPAPGGDCSKLSAPAAIVSCNLDKWGSLRSSEAVDFLRSTARDLNRAGISGGPFGILVKTGGANCNGYSCDIICSGQGSRQRQWDVLIDSGRGGSTWREVGPGLAVRPCEIQ
jgi:hypothetical protein